MINTTTNPSHGVRRIRLTDQAPACEIVINGPAYEIREICRNRNVVDIGCGFGRLRSVVESCGGTWTGVEPFGGSDKIVVADAEDLPFSDNTFDVAIMHAVMEHIPDVSRAIAEAARVLKPGGVLIGYVAFMECFHEISYSHLSFKSLEHFAVLNGMKLEKIAGGSRFGIDYHLQVLLYPIPFNWARPLVASMIRGWIRMKSRFGYWGLRRKRKYSVAESKEKSLLYYKVECLRMSQGFDFVIRKNF